jgi:mycothiol synthase
MQTQVAVTIRPFNPTDYEAITAIHNANFGPEFAKEPDELRFWDEHREDYCKIERWVAECDGKVVAFGEYSQSGHQYDPRRFTLNISVDPAYYLRGIGRRLYDLVTSEVSRHQPKHLDEWTREDMLCRVGFLERRGFVPDMRMWTSVLDLTRFDPSQFVDVVDSVSEQGIELRSFGELGVDDPEVRRAIHEMWLEIRHDVPVPPGVEPSAVSFERYWEATDRPSLWPAGFFIAMDGVRFVGLSQLWLSPSEPGVLRTGLTGTLRTYRRRGIAFALKVRALQTAKAAGYRYAKTENEINNVGMLAINDTLGFKKNPAWIHYTLKVT